MKLGYLVNQYPKTSHSFVRREITALESHGHEVLRVSVRPPADDLVDPKDLDERERTHVLLESGLGGLVPGMLACALTRPLRFLRALGTAITLGRRSDRGLLRHFAYLAEACALQRLAAREGVEHVHAHFGTNPPMVALLCEDLGGPGFSFTVHGPEEFDRPRALKLGEKIARARFTVAISEFGRSQLYRWCDHAHWKRVEVIHCGVDEVFLGERPAPLEDVPRLVCVGRLCEQKGQLLLVEAAAILAREGVEFELVLAGDGEMRAEIELNLAALGVTDQVRITGWVKNTRVRDEILAARALVLPSFAEGLPVVIMEALALERPVISTYVAGIPELVVPGECGWLTPAGDVQALADAMRSALTTPVDELRAMGERGARRVRAQHDAKVEARKLGELFQGAG